jgi:hypothetical protein
MSEMDFRKSRNCVLGYLWEIEKKRVRIENGGKFGSNEGLLHNKIKYRSEEAANTQKSR